jgi:hypothetical protein
MEKENPKQSENFDKYYAALNALKDEPYDPFDFDRMKEVFSVVGPVFKALHSFDLEPNTFFHMAHWYIDKPYGFNEQGKLIEQDGEKVDFLLHLTRLLKNVVNSEFAENALKATAIHKHGRIENADAKLLSQIEYHNNLKSHSMHYAKELMKNAIERIKEEENKKETEDEDNHLH